MISAAVGSLSFRLVITYAEHTPDTSFLVSKVRRGSSTRSVGNRIVSIMADASALNVLGTPVFVVLNLDRPPLVLLSVLLYSSYLLVTWYLVPGMYVRCFVQAVLLWSFH